MKLETMESRVTGPNPPCELPGGSDPIKLLRLSYRPPAEGSILQTNSVRMKTPSLGSGEERDGQETKVTSRAVLSRVPEIGELWLAQLLQHNWGSLTTSNIKRSCVLCWHHGKKCKLPLNWYI